MPSHHTSPRIYALSYNGYSGTQDHSSSETWTGKIVVDLDRPCDWCLIIDKGPGSYYYSLEAYLSLVVGLRHEPLDPRGARELRQLHDRGPRFTPQFPRDPATPSRYIRHVLKAL